MFAIVRVGNKQFKVAPKDVITVDSMAGNVGDTVELSDVLLVQGEKSVKVGKPLVKGAKVTAKIVAHTKGEKIEIRRFKSKVRYRRARGFRAQLTNLEIVGITQA
jgi:large subunit ribosomal protein L21